MFDCVFDIKVGIVFFSDFEDFEDFEDLQNFQELFGLKNFRRKNESLDLSHRD